MKYNECFENGAEESTCPNGCCCCSGRVQFARRPHCSVSESVISYAFQTQGAAAIVIGLCLQLPWRRTLTAHAYSVRGIFNRARRCGINGLTLELAAPGYPCSNCAFSPCPQLLIPEILRPYRTLTKPHIIPIYPLESIVIAGLHLVYYLS